MGTTRRWRSRGRRKRKGRRNVGWWVRALLGQMYARKYDKLVGKLTTLHESVDRSHEGVTVSIQQLAFEGAALKKLKSDIQARLA